MEKKYGLIGYPLTHSFSRKYFTDKFLMEGIADSYAYENFELKSLDEFPHLIQSQPTLAGLNVTIPYKEQIIPWLDELREYAVPAGAVNLIKIERNAKGKVVRTLGYNTDVTGFYGTLKTQLKFYHTGALVLGTGGASKAVQHALKLLKLPFIIVGRKKGTGIITYNELTRELVKQYPVIVNTTPLGTFPDIGSYPDIPYEALGPLNLLYDLVYNPAESVFLRKGSQYAAQTINGFKMLVAQAEASWQIWSAPQKGP